MNNLYCKDKTRTYERNIMSPPTQPHRNQLCWPVSRTKRSFRFYVVEPPSYSPKEHARVFYAAINGLLTRRISEVDSDCSYNMPSDSERFDLVTFPEAFLPEEDLLITLRSIVNRQECGCVHVGLRPTSEEPHLFKVDEIKSLLEKLREISAIEQADLKTFSTWIEEQPRNRLFNIGCIFMLDSRGKLRVCLHPKVIKSKFEIAMPHEQNMSEANMLTLVSLIPEDKRFLSITIQPLICSDALNSETERPGARPLYAANDDQGDGVDTWWPDQIDVVSLATCTPQPEYGPPTETFSQWHPAFQETFYRAASDDALLKHNHAIFALSNFRVVSDGEPGGLSGAFIPVPFTDARLPGYLTVSVWGHPTEHRQADSWSKPTERPTDVVKWRNLGYIASLRTSSPDAAARMIGFTVNKLPRQASRWHKHSGLTDFQLFEASIDSSGTQLAFKQQDER